MFRRHWLRRQRRLSKALRGTLIHRWLGEHLFRTALWAPDRRAVAGGVALGLFIAFTPTIPFQMLLAAAGALLLKVNLPAAVAGVWVTNPVTAVPVFLAARRLGVHMLHDTWLFDLIQGFIPPDRRYAMFLNQAAYLWTGSLVLSTVAALGGWAFVNVAWTLLARKRPADRNGPRGDRAEPPAGATPDPPGSG